MEPICCSSCSGCCCYCYRCYRYRFANFHLQCGTFGTLALYRSLYVCVCVCTKQSTKYTQIQTRHTHCYTYTHWHTHVDTRAHCDFTRNKTRAYATTFFLRCSLVAHCLYLSLSVSVSLCFCLCLCRLWFLWAMEVAPRRRLRSNCSRKCRRVALLKKFESWELAAWLVLLGAQRRVASMRSHTRTHTHLQIQLCYKALQFRQAAGVTFCVFCEFNAFIELPQLQHTSVQAAH